MALAGDTNIQLGAFSRNLPLKPLIEAWRSADFQPERCADDLAKWMKQYRITEDWFQPQEVRHGGIAATDQFVFGCHGQEQEWIWSFSSVDRASSFVARVPLEYVADVAHVTRSVYGFSDAEEFGVEFGEFLDDPVQDAIGRTFTHENTFGEWPAVPGAGILRREHASVVISSGIHSIIFDPQGYNRAWTTGNGRYPADRATRFDAVAITHSHADHWHLPSILRHSDSTTTVLVPAVPRQNLLTPVDFSAALSISGQRHVCLGWEDRFQVGDIEIQALPFYGEQPTRSSPGAAEGVRNWGNCYLVKCPQFSVLVLADSGADAMGDMREVVARAASRHTIDAIVSCCGRFPEGANDGLLHYALVVPFERLREIHVNGRRGDWQSITSGPEGIAELCAIANARYFLPYAHGFGGLGRDVFVEGLGFSERNLVAPLEQKLTSLGGKTRIIPWQVGEFFDPGQ